MDNRYIGELSTDVYGAPINEMRIGHIHLSEDQATKLDTDGLLEAVGSGDNPTAWVASNAVLTNSTADTLTIKTPAMWGEAPNGKVKFLIATNSSDALDVSVGTGANSDLVTVKVANASESKNTGALIQAAIRELGEVGGIDLSQITCTPSASWDAQTVAAEISPTAQALANGVTGTVVVYTLAKGELEEMPYPRNVTADTGGTSGHVGNVAVTVYGTNMDGKPIEEQLPYFTAGSKSSAVGSKIFKTVTAVSIPAHDNTGATTQIGFGNKIGLPFKLAYKPLNFVMFNGVLETSPATFALNDKVLENNSITLSTTLNDKEVEIFLVL